MSEYPNQEVLINCLLEVEHDIEQLLNICKITPGIPVKPMLAKPTKDISVIFKRFEVHWILIKEYEIHM
jgi:DNA ligase-1